jgi:3-isopropylmalate/(R)-2-methylmalate dehydratase small subunit
MQPFVKHTGLVVAMDRANVDTDQIIPKQFLKRIERTGFGQFLFFDWRFLDDGKPNPEFELNQPALKGASILLARRNFGCGSSREHAPWALQDYGFQVVIAPSFADIFFNNCFKNGLLPIVLSEFQMSSLFDETAAFVGYRLTIDLERQVVVRPGGEAIGFDVEPFRKSCLLGGFDDIALTLRHAEAIRTFEAERLLRQPWLAATI